jgi:ATP-dependent helicase/nuclease subunit A
VIRFVDDAAARRLATTEYTLPVAIEAGAGTGKTRTLVSRIGSWLLGPGWERARGELAEERAARGDTRATAAEIAARACDGLVAITFTDAAAAEMAARVDALLAEAAGGELPRDLDDWPPDVDGAERVARAEALLASASRLRLSTIHGFCHRLLAESPLEAGLHPGFEVDPDGERTAELATAGLLARLRGGAPELVELLAAGVDPPELLEALAKLSAAGVAAGELDGDPFQEHVLAPRFAALAAALDLLFAAAAPLAGGRRVKSIEEGLQALARLRQELRETPPTGEGLVALDPALEDAAVSASKILDKWARNEVGETENKILGGATEELVAAAAETARAHAALHQLDPRLTRLARRALREPLSELAARRRAEGIVSFDELLERAARLLTERAGVRARVRRGIRQLLVDEFQDTDGRQCDLLRALVLAPADAAPPGLFLVGDPKQSIYGWRSADLAAYAGFLDDLAAAGGRFGRLEVNYRSQPPILAEVERALAPVLVEEPGLQTGFQPLRPSPRNAGGAGFAAAGRAAVEYWESSDPAALADGESTRAERATEIEATAIARDVAELVADGRARWSDFGLLLRARGDLDLFLDAFRRAGVPYVVQKDRSYYRRREVVDAAAAARAVLDPDDLLAAVAFLRSPFVGVPDSAWLPLWRAGFPAAWIAADGERGTGAALAAARAAEAEPVDGLPKSAHAPGWADSLAAAVESVAALRADFRRLPAGDWVERFRARLLLEPIAAARFLGRFGLANLERFFADLEEALAGEPDPGRALAALRQAIAEERPAEEARPPEAQADAVAVMTIHTAKGLQFRHVYLAQAQKRSGDRPGAALPTVAIGPPAEGVANREMVLFGAPTPGWLEVEAARRRVAAAEAARLLYVATTRAIDRLVICGRWAAEPRKLHGGAAPSFAELLAPRLAGAPVPTPEAPEQRDADGVLWRLAGDGVPGDARPTLASAPATPEEPNDFDELARRRDLARRRSSRARFATASALAADPTTAVDGVVIEGARRAAGGRDADFAAARSRAVARARGVALHRALELSDLAVVDLEAWQDRVRDAFRSALVDADAGEIEAVAAAADALRDTFLCRQLCLLSSQGRIVARELPLVAGAYDDSPAAPLGGYVGTLDLLYREGDSGSLVVADFKSDEVADDPAAVAALAARYQPQLSLYGRAVRDALGLAAPPRLEIWLLALDRVVAVDPV